MVTYVQSLLIPVFASRMETMAYQICASILGDDWSPTLSVMAICITIQSMLASCKVRLVLQNAVTWLWILFLPVSAEERTVSRDIFSWFDISY